MISLSWSPLNMIKDAAIRLLPQLQGDNKVVEGGGLD
jgi:hypothetical protein